MSKRKGAAAAVIWCGSGIVLVGLLIAWAAQGADEVAPLQQAFLEAKDVKTRYELADRLLALGDPAVPFLAEVLNTPKHDGLFPTEDVRRVFRSRLAVKMGSLRTPAAAAALQG
jgi:hypothetical protein